MFCPPSPIYPTRSPPPHVQGQSKGCKWIGLVKEGKLSLSDIFPTFQMFTKRCSGPDIQSLWVFCHLIFVGNNHDVVHRSKMTKTLGVSMRPASHSIISLSHSIIILSSPPWKTKINSVVTFLDYNTFLAVTEKDLVYELLLMKMSALAGEGVKVLHTGDMSLAVT